LSRPPSKARLVIMISLILVCLLGGSCTPDRALDKRLKSITKPYTFNFVSWEWQAIKALCCRDNQTDDEVNKVTEYFSSAERIKSLKSAIAAGNADNPASLASLEAELSELQQKNMALTETVTRVLERQIRETLFQEGIFHPIDKYIRVKVGFPPVSFEIEDPPHLLVISPRDKIESMREIALRQDLSVEEMEGIEGEVDKSNVSSLVVELGGFSTYPHKYLAFKPLGFRYVLDLTGIHRDYEIATMNEALAGMVSEEIGAIVCEKYYDQDDVKPKPAGSGFDFNREMREIRRAVDEYLARGEIEPAEKFMEQKRQYLAENGYHLRKLNQAYFAFHGTYADKPTSISPIGLELKQLRSQSASLKDSEFPFQLLIGLGQGFRHYSDIRQNGHNVGVTLPPRHDVGMKMVLDARPGYPAQICPDVKAAGVKCLPQHTDSPADNLEVLVSLRPGKLLQTGYMPVRGYHQVSGVIGIAVQNDEVMLAPIQYMVGIIIIFCRLVAQDAPLWFLHLDILYAPGRPDTLHISLLNVTPLPF